jgi:hypothetical protein
MRRLATPLRRFAAPALLAALLAPAGARAPAAATTNRLIILSTTDLKGKTSPCGCHTPKGGLARLASFADSVRNLEPRTLLVDAGGFFPEDDLHQPVVPFLMGTMKLIGEDAVGLGDRDLRFGLAFLKANVEKSGVPLVCANLYDKKTNQPVFPPYVIKDVNGVKVGIYGVINDKVDLGPSMDSVYAVEPSNVSMMVIEDMKKKGATVIVLLSQLGKVITEDLSVSLNGVDAVIVGRDVPLMMKGLKVGKALLCYGGEQGQYVGRTQFALTPRNRVASGESEMFMLGPDVPSKPVIADMVTAYEDNFNAQMAKRNREAAAHPDTSHAGGAHFLGTEVCIRCHAVQGEQWRTTPHARAYQTLVDKKKDSTPECVTCHVVGFQQAGGFFSHEATPAMENVGCENCHGKGSEHDVWSKSRRNIPSSTCLSCHDATTSPEFDYDKFRHYVDHTKKFNELPPLKVAQPMRGSD